MFRQFKWTSLFFGLPMSSLVTMVLFFVGMIALILLPKQLVVYPHAFTPVALLVITLLGLLLAIIFILKRPESKFYFSPLTPILVILAADLAIVGVIKYNLIPLKYLLSFPGIFIALATLSLIGSAMINFANSKIIIRLLTSLAILSAFAGAFLFATTILASKHLDVYLNYFDSSLLINLQIMGVTAYLANFFKKGKLSLKKDILFLPLIILGLLFTMIVNKTQSSLYTNWSETFTIAKQLFNESSTNITHWLIGGQGDYSELAHRYLPNQLIGNYQQSFSTPLTLLLMSGIIAPLSFLSLILYCWYLSFQSKNPRHHLYFILATSFTVCCFTPYHHLLSLIHAGLIASCIPKNKFTLTQLPVWAFWRGHQLLSRRVGNLCLLMVVIIYFLLGSWLVTESLLGFYFYHHSLTKSNDVPTFILLANKTHQVAPHIDDFARLSALGQLELIKQNVGSETAAIDHFHQAVALAQKAIDLNPYSTINYLTLASIHQEINPYLDQDNQLHNQKNITSPLAKAISLQPKNSELYLALADAYLAQDQNQEAVALYQKALNLKPNLLSAQFHLGLAYRKLDQEENARQAFIDALSLLNPQDPEFIQNYQLINEQLLN